MSKYGFDRLVTRGSGEVESTKSPAPAQPVVLPTASSSGSITEGTNDQFVLRVIRDQEPSPELEGGQNIELPPDISQEAVDDFHKQASKHVFRNIMIGVIAVVVAVVGSAVAYEKACQVEDTKPSQPRPTAPSVTPSAATETPTTAVVPVKPVVVEQPPVVPAAPEPIKVKCDFSSQPPGNVSWDCGDKVVESSIQFDEGKSIGENYGGVFTFTTVDGQEVNCELTLQKPADRTKPQKLNSTLDCE